MKKYKTLEALEKAVVKAGRKKLNKEEQEQFCELMKKEQSEEWQETLDKIAKLRAAGDENGAKEEEGSWVVFLLEMVEDDERELTDLPDLEGIKRLYSMAVLVWCWENGVRQERIIRKKLSEAGIDCEQASFEDLATLQKRAIEVTTLWRDHHMRDIRRALGDDQFNKMMREVRGDSRAKQF